VELQIGKRRTGSKRKRKKRPVFLFTAFLLLGSTLSREDKQAFTQQQKGMRESRMKCLATTTEAHGVGATVLVE